MVHIHIHIVPVVYILKKSLVSFPLSRNKEEGSGAAQSLFGMPIHRRCYHVTHIPRPRVFLSFVGTTVVILLLLQVSSLSQTQSKNPEITLLSFVPSMVQALSSGAAVVTTASPSTYDVIVIGGGSAGITAAKLIGPTLQKSCCIIEQHKMGGDCTWTGCIPSKSFIAASKSYYAAQQQQQQLRGTTTTSTNTHHVPPPLADLTVVRAELRQKIQQIYVADDSPEALTRLGNIDVIYGSATIESSKLVQVTTTTSDTEPQQQAVHAKEGIIICTGAEPRLPTMIPGLDQYFTYETIWDQLTTIPKQFIVLGGGPIGCELAQAMARFGSNVTIITTSSTILPQEDPEVSSLMSQILTTQYNIQIVHGSVTKVDQVSPTTGTTSTHVAYVSLLSGTSTGSSAATTTTVSGDAILVAIGRQPRCIPGYENVGIELNEHRTAIKVNAQLQTSVPNIYAAGDCTGDRQL